MPSYRTGPRSSLDPDYSDGRGRRWTHKISRIRGERYSQLLNVPSGSSAANFIGMKHSSGPGVIVPPPSHTDRINMICQQVVMKQSALQGESGDESGAGEPRWQSRPTKDRQRAERVEKVTGQITEEGGFGNGASTTCTCGFCLARPNQ